MKKLIAITLGAGAVSAALLTAGTASADLQRVETGTASGSHTEPVKSKITTKTCAGEDTAPAACGGTAKLKVIEFRITELKPATDGRVTQSLGFAPIPQTFDATRNYWERVDGKTPIPESIQIGLGTIDDPLAPAE